MAEKTALPPAPYISDNPEQDWERFVDAMRHILTVPKPKLEQAPSQSNAKDAKVKEDRA